MRGIPAILSLTVCLFLTADAHAEQLTISYFERPPYYYTGPDGQSHGCLVERTRAVLAQAGLDAPFFSLAPAQILFLIKHSPQAHCSIGWFKTPEREFFAAFSAPIYQNDPMVLLSSKKQRTSLSNYKTAKELFRDRSLIFGRLITFSYGDYIDDLLEESTPTGYIKAQSQQELLEALLTDRVSYMLVAPEEVDTMIREAGFERIDFFTHSLTDIPEGNLRYLMCTKQINNALMERINLAIDQLSSATINCD
jgi:polar amino acid transport system substrate-binding protein